MRVRVLGVVAVVIAITPAFVAGQSASSRTSNGATRSALPRMPDGHPDLQGTYDVATLTRRSNDLLGCRSC